LPVPPAPAAATSPATPTTPTTPPTQPPRPKIQTQPPSPSASPRPSTTQTMSAATPPSGPAPAIAQAPDANQAHAIRDNISAKLAQVDANVDHFVLLEVPRHAGSTEIKAAYLQLAKTYHPDRLALVKLEEMRPQVERIFARLSDAFSAIGDDGRRHEYIRV